MPRKVRDEKLDTRTARLKLTPRREPYWRSIQEGRAIGYRRLTGGRAGTWIARYYDPTDGRSYEALGVADDFADADGKHTLTFAQAQEKAAEWFRTLLHPEKVIGPLTVREAVQTYLEGYDARGGKAPANTRSVFDAHISPEFGDRQVSDLTTPAIRQWHQRLAAAPARLRSKQGATKRRVRHVNADDTDGRRARRATANRILTYLKAALNLAFNDGRVASDDAWRRVKPFPKCSATNMVGGSVDQDENCDRAWGDIVAGD